MPNLPIASVIRRHQATIVLHPDALPPDADRRVRALIEVLPELLPHDPKVWELAERVQLSGKQLREIFNRVTGGPVKQYLKALQMELAGSLLQHEGLTIPRVMQRIGVVDYSHFMREFKRVYGVTPATYRQAQRQRAGERALWQAPASGSGPEQAC